MFDTTSVSIGRLVFIFFKSKKKKKNKKEKKWEEKKRKEEKVVPVLGSIIFNKYKEQVLASWAFKWGDNYIELFALEVGHFPPLLSIILLFCESLFSNLLFYLLYLSRQELKIFTTLKGTVMQIVSNF